MLYSIECLRAIAVALITNSHFKGIYPSDILSFGGGLGLALFYMLSGFLLANLSKTSSFASWYQKKLLRMYVPQWIFLTIAVIIGYRTVTSLGSFVRQFLFPSCWFVASMVIFYVLYYFFVRCIVSRWGDRSILGAMIFSIAIFTVLFITESPIGTYALDNWTPHSFSLETPYLIMQPIWFFCMLTGLWLRRHSHQIQNVSSQLLYPVLAAIFVLLFMVTKLLIARNLFPYTRYLLAVSYIGFAYCAFRYLYVHERLCSRIFHSLPGRLISVISTCSLEIYYVQFVWIATFKHLAFPLNFLLICIGIIFSAWVLHQVSNLFLNKCRRMTK